MRLKLVHALTQLAAINDEAQLHTTKPKVLAALATMATDADAAARAVQFDQPLTPRQAALVAECEKEISQ